jgi:hypothetical protein
VAAPIGGKIREIGTTREIGGKVDEEDETG